MQAAGHFPGGEFGVSILLTVNAIPVPIFKIDPEVFNRFGFQFRDNSIVNRECEPRRRISLLHSVGVLPQLFAQGIDLLRGFRKRLESMQLESAGKRNKVWGILKQRLQSDFTQLCGCVSFEYLGAAIHRVDGLACTAFAGISCCE